MSHVTLTDRDRGARLDTTAQQQSTLRRQRSVTVTHEDLRVGEPLPDRSADVRHGVDATPEHRVVGRPVTVHEAR
jgi:hypothetical protein